MTSKAKKKATVEMVESKMRERVVLAEVKPEAPGHVLLGQLSPTRPK